jgi:hypothetical protein
MIINKKLEGSDRNLFYNTVPELERGVGVRVLVGAKFVSSPRHPDRLWSPPILLSNGYRGIFLRRVKQPGREADHIRVPPTTSEVKNAWIYTPTLPYALIAYCLIS